jgi:hypothetical protein
MLSKPADVFDRDAEWADLGSRPSFSLCTTARDQERRQGRSA